MLRFLAFASVVTIINGSFSVAGPRILNSDKEQVQFRCLNWAGHMQTNLPEGLNNNSISAIFDVITSEGNLFNCLRINYSVELMMDEAVLNMTARESLTNNNHPEFDYSQFVTGFEGEGSGGR